MLGQRTPECQLPAGITIDELWGAMGGQIYSSSRSKQTVFKKGPTTWAIWPGPDQHGVKTVLIDNRDPRTFPLIAALRSAPLKSGRVFVRNLVDGETGNLQVLLPTPDFQFIDRVPHMFARPQVPRSEVGSVGLDIFPVQDDEALDKVVCLRSQYAKESIQTVRRRIASDILGSLAAGNIRIMLVQKEGLPVATATATNYQGLIGFMNVLTAEAFRNQGIATAMMQNLLDFYDRQNVAGYHLLSSGGAFNMYRNLGFEVADFASLYEWRRLSQVDRLDARLGEMFGWLTAQSR